MRRERERNERSHYYEERVEEHLHNFREEGRRRTERLWQEIIAETPVPLPSALIAQAPPAPPPTADAQVSAPMHHSGSATHHAPHLPEDVAASRAQEQQSHRALEAAAQARVEEEQRAQLELANAQRRQERDSLRVQLRLEVVSVPWNNARAIAVYQERCKIFDMATFDHVTPMTFDMAPWPVLKHPVELTEEDITSLRVDEFFETALRHRYVPYEKLKSMIRESATRWHPDRWKARGIFNSVANEDYAGWEGLVTTVAQALMPMRDEVKQDTFPQRLLHYRNYNQ